MTKKDKVAKSLPGTELFHVKLRQAAKAAGVTGMDLAGRLAVNESTVYRWYGGKLDPTGAQTCLMMLWFGIGPEALVELPRTGQSDGKPGRRAGLEGRLQELEDQVRRLAAELDAQDATSRSKESAADRAGAVERMEQGKKQHLPERIRRKQS